MKTIALLILASFCIVTALAQPAPDTLWTKTYGRSANESCKSVQQTADGGFVLAGYTRPVGLGYYDFWLVKTAANGDSLWSRSYGGNSDDYCVAAQQTRDGGYFLAGWTMSFGAGNRDFWLLKTDEFGDSLWSRTFGDPGNEICYSALQTLDGNFVLAGDGPSVDERRQMLLVKFDTDGDLFWSSFYDRNYSSCCNSIRQTTDGGFILAGYTADTSAVGLNDAYLVKTNSVGDTIWTRTFGGAAADIAYSVQQTDDGGYIVAAETHSFGVGTPSHSNFWLIKTDANGDSLWSRVFGGTGTEVCRSAWQTYGGSFVSAGSQNPSAVAGDYDFCVVKVGVNGDSLWSCVFGGEEDDVCYSVLQTVDAAYVLAGATFSFGSGHSDFWLLRTTVDELSEPPGPFDRALPADSMLLSDPHVQFAWTRSLDPENDPVTYLLHVVSSTYPLPDPYILTTTDTSIIGEIPIPVTPLDEIHEFRWTIHAFSRGDTVEASNGMGVFFLDIPDAADESSLLHPASFALSASPNPFNVTTTLAYDLPADGRVSLVILNLLGEEIRSLTYGTQSAGTHTIAFDGSGLASGIYFARLDAGAFSQTRKLVLLK